MKNTIFTMSLCLNIALTLNPVNGFVGGRWRHLEHRTKKLGILSRIAASPAFSRASSSSAATDEMRKDAQEETEKLEKFYETVPFEKPQFWKTRQEGADYVSKNIDTILFDCDGVLYRTLDQCPGASNCIEGLMEKGKKVLFVTNNAGVNRRELRDKLSKVLGIGSLTNDQMVSSSYSCAQYLKSKLMPGSRVHVVGSAGLCEELANSSFQISGGPSLDQPSSMNRQDLADYDFPEHPIDAIAVGHDVAMNFRKLCIADNLLLRNPKALFVATNEDSFDLVGSDRRHIPGNGCTVKALEYCSKRKAVCVGKPSTTLANLIMQEHQIDPSRALFVGDRLDTDILFAKANGMKSLLVMTGVTSAQTMVDLERGTEEEPLPDFIAPSVEVLV
jgi:phosphoglycolate/pyridoxal phosphate phosphatase family enzyme